MEKYIRARWMTGPRPATLPCDKRLMSCWKLAWWKNNMPDTMRDYVKRAKALVEASRSGEARGAWQNAA